MDLDAEEFERAGVDTHAVIEAAKAAGASVFGGGLAEHIDPVMVSSDGRVATGTYPFSSLTGGFTVPELPTRADAEVWATRIVAARRCEQELRGLVFDPAS